MGEWSWGTLWIKKALEVPALYPPNTGFVSNFAHQREGERANMHEKVSHMFVLRKIKMRYKILLFSSIENFVSMCMQTVFTGFFLFHATNCIIPKLSIPDFSHMNCSWLLNWNIYTNKIICLFCLFGCEPSLSLSLSLSLLFYFFQIHHWKLEVVARQFTVSFSFWHSVFLLFAWSVRLQQFGRMLTH